MLLLSIVDPKMYEGKQMRADLISELRTTHALQSPEKMKIQKQEEEILGQQRAREREQHMVRVTIARVHV